MKKMNHYPIKPLRKIIIVLAIYMIPFGLSAQDAIVYKTFINKNGLVILDVQKALMAEHITNVDGQLAKIMRLQIKAIELFNKKDYSLAAYTSNVSREEAIKLLSKLNPEIGKLYTISDDEKKLFAFVSSQPTESKQNTSIISAKDEDYLEPGQVIKKIRIE